MATKTAEKKTEPKKAPVKAATAAEAKVEAPKKALGKLEVTAFDISGKETGSVTLVEEVFGGKVNKSLLAQALRVYNTNRAAHRGNTKTRGEVVGSTRKIFRQKGTGNARHGSLLAPIFVGGGIALGPRVRKVELELPKKMRQAALKAALAQKQVSGEIVGLLGADKASGKTKDAVTLVNALGKKSVLIVDGAANENVARMVKNLKGIDFMSATQVNVFEIVAHQSLVLTKEAVDTLAQRFAKKENTENA